MQSAVLILFLASVTPGLGGPLASQGHFAIQENFDLDKFMGKWYDVAVASTCPWLMSHKGKMFVGTMELKPGDSNTVDVTRTAFRHGTCKQFSVVYELTETPGRLFYHNSKWGADVDSYVVHTNYDEYAIVAMTKQKQGGNRTTTLKLYGRSMDLRQSLRDDFTQLVKEQSMSEDTIVFLRKTEECTPGDPVPETAIQRARRNVVLPPPEEGSGDDTPLFLDAVACQKDPDAGPCFGMRTRYYYNSSLMACQEFTFGGCMGNQNNFGTEKECLQHCRTEAACRLPMDPGPCLAGQMLWAFDSVIGKCVSFKYGGCQGNGNKFYSQRECEEYCGVMKEGEEQLLKVK